MTKKSPNGMDDGMVVANQLRQGNRLWYACRAISKHYGQLSIEQGSDIGATLDPTR